VVESSSLWRLKSYLRPHLRALALIWVAATAGIAVGS